MRKKLASVSEMKKLAKKYKILLPKFFIIKFRKRIAINLCKYRLLYLSRKDRETIYPFLKKKKNIY